MAECEGFLGERDRSVCVSTLGTVFEEASPGELSTTATVKKDQVETLQFLAKYTRVFLLTQCADDAGWERMGVGIARGILRPTKKVGESGLLKSSVLEEVVIFC